MTQGLKEPLVHRRHLGRSWLLQRHPVLTPVVLLGSSLLLGIAGVYGDSVFPILTFVELPVNALSTLVLLCVLVAFVLGIVGVLVGIIGILEQVDRSCSPVAMPMTMFSRLKEQSYANRN
ncbi:MAG: hypothetical protein NVS4B12_01450 [Ktedonobacteraceae bacterium]